MWMRKWDLGAVASLLAAFVLSLVGLGYTQLQSQEAINAVLSTKMGEIERRIENLERSNQYIVGVVLAQVVAHLFQIQSNRKRRY